MAQQSKITSRPLTKALGTASILSMAIAGASMANAVQTDFGVTYQADAFNVDGEAHGTDRSQTGFANLLRIKADFKDETTGTSIHTSVQLSGDYWTGDGRDALVQQSADPSYNDTNEQVTLDTGFLQIPISGNLLRVGRQASSYNNCFLTCDDRRDRVIGIFPTAVGTFTANYDRRRDTVQDFVSSDSGDQVGVSYTTKVGGFTVGALWFHWLKNTGGAGYPFQGAHGASSYINGAVTEGVNLKAGFNWVGQNEASDEMGLFGSEDPAGDGWSYYLRAEGDAGLLNWGAQYVHTIDGGLMSNGYNTYSSLINNTPDSKANPTSLISLGRGFGTQDYDQQLVIGKLGFDITPRFNLTGAVGYLKVDNGTNDDSSTVYDLSGSFEVNDSVTTIATIGVVTENEVMNVAGNTLVSSVSGSDFANEDLMAAKLGLRVSF